MIRLYRRDKRTCRQKKAWRILPEEGYTQISNEVLDGDEIADAESIVRSRHTDEEDIVYNTCYDPVRKEYRLEIYKK